MSSQAAQRTVDHAPLVLDDPGATVVTMDDGIEPLYKTSRDLQATTVALKRRIAELERDEEDECAETARGDRQSRRKHASEKDDEDPEQPNNEEQDKPGQKKRRKGRSGIDALRCSARHVALSVALFVGDWTEFTHARLRHDHDPKLCETDRKVRQNLSRYGTDAKVKIQVIAHGVHDALPVALRGSLKEDWVADELHSCSTDIRSTMSSRIRAHADIIFDLERRSVKDAAARVAFEGRIGLVAVGKKHLFNPMRAEVLYVDYDDEFDATKIFRAPALKRIYILFFYGPASFENFVDDKWPQVPDGECNATLWHCDHVTPGDIAMIATYARFALSTDKNFQERGANSGIEYKEDYYKYLQYLHIGLATRKASVIDLFEEWNDAIFPGRVASSSKQADADFDEAMAALEADHEMPGEDSEEEEEEGRGEGIEGELEDDDEQRPDSPGGGHPDHVSDPEPEEDDEEEAEAPAPRRLTRQRVG